MKRIFITSEARQLAIIITIRYLLRSGLITTDEVGKVIKQLNNESDVTLAMTLIESKEIFEKINKK